MAEFEYCLRCGQPLRSWWSRRDGFGFDCWQALSRAERRQLVEAARALQTDLDVLDTIRGRPRVLDRVRALLVRRR